MRSGTVENLHDFKGKLDKIKELKIFKKIYAVTLDKCGLKNKSKKLLTKSSESDILNRLSREMAKESSKRATKKNKKSS